MQNLSGARKIQYFAFLLFTLDIFFLGSGVNYAIAGINSRKIFLIIFGAISICIYICHQNFNSRKNIRSIQVFGFSVFILLWIIVIPELTHGNLSYSISDALPLVAPGIFLVTTDFGKGESGWGKIRGIVFFSLFLFLLLHAVLYGLSRSDVGLFESIRKFLLVHWDSNNVGSAQFVFLNPTDTGKIRIYFGSSFLLLMGLYFFAQQYEPLIKNIGILKIAFFLLILIALWATDTRSLMLGAGVFLVLLPVSKRLIPKIRINLFSVILMIVLPFLLSFALLPSIDPHFLEVLGTVREGSDNLRADQFWPLSYAFLSHPILGRGFGASASFIRLEDTPYAYELSILALFMKIGLLGFAWVCVVFSSSIRSAIPDKIKQYPKKISPLYCLYFSYIVSCVFNPYMFGLFGTFFALFLLYEFVFLTENSKND